jgi:hypothetical protein
LGYFICRLVWTVWDANLLLLMLLLNWIAAITNFLLARQLYFLNTIFQPVWHVSEHANRWLVSCNLFTKWVEMPGAAKLQNKRLVSFIGWLTVPGIYGRLIPAAAADDDRDDACR